MSFASTLPPWLRLSGQTAIVTGSSSGIGRASALQLASLGASILCADLMPTNRQGLTCTHDVILQRGGQAEFAHANVSDYKAVADLVQQATAMSIHRRLDIMVNNAGLSGHQRGAHNVGIHSEDEAFADSVMRVNYRGVWNGTKAAVIQMLTQKVQLMPADQVEDDEELLLQKSKRGSRGVIINIGSIHGLVGGPAERAYRIGPVPFQCLPNGNEY